MFPRSGNYYILDEVRLLAILQAHLGSKGSAYFLSGRKLLRRAPELMMTIRNELTTPLLVQLLNWYLI